MRITIVEEEIKAAVKTFIASQLTLAEGQDIQIEFKSTRGDDGLTADVTVTLAGTKAESPKVPAPTKVSGTTQATKAVEITQTVAESVPKVEAVVVPDEAEKTIVGEAEVETVQTELGVDATDEPTQAAPEPETEKPRSSLFAGLKRPENS